MTAGNAEAFRSADIEAVTGIIFTAGLPLPAARFANAIRHANITLIAGFSFTAWRAVPPAGFAVAVLIAG